MGKKIIDKTTRRDASRGRKSKAGGGNKIKSHSIIYTVSGQNVIGIYIIPMTLIQLTGYKQNDVCNNQLLKLQPAVMNKMLFAIIGCLNYSWLYCSNFVTLQPAVISTTSCFIQDFVYYQ